MSVAFAQLHALVFVLRANIRPDDGNGLIRGQNIAFERAAAGLEEVLSQVDSPDLTDPAVQKRLATQWGYVRGATKTVWLVELFRGDGNETESLGYFFTGLVALGGEARSTTDRTKGVRYRSREEAETRVAKLGLAGNFYGTWKAAEHQINVAEN